MRLVYGRRGYEYVEDTIILLQVALLYAILKYRTILELTPHFMMNDEFAKKIEDIKKDFAQLGKQLADITAMSTHQIEDYRKDAVNNLKETATEVSKQVQKEAKMVDEYAHENPWLIVAGFSVAGLLLGMLLSLGKSKK